MGTVMVERVRRSLPKSGRRKEQSGGRRALLSVVGVFCTMASRVEVEVPCPFFLPTEKISGALWPFPSRLPLGEGWRGECTAPGHEHSMPQEEELRECCNLGYARTCSRLPQDRAADAVRFSVSLQSGNILQIFYVCERNHAPGETGTIEYDAGLGRWTSQHANPVIQKLAECYVEAYQSRRHEMRECALS